MNFKTSIQFWLLHLPFFYNIVVFFLFVSCTALSLHCFIVAAQGWNDDQLQKIKLTGLVAANT